MKYQADYSTRKQHRTGEKAKATHDGKPKILASPCGQLINAELHCTSVNRVPKPGDVVHGRWQPFKASLLLTSPPHWWSC